ncbi:MAG: hypothetical protein ACPGYV_01610 [Phycisphaeraceae bacterium]
MDYEPLQIRDSETRTHGGPPGWLAFSVIIGSVGLMASAAFIVGLAM